MKKLNLIILSLYFVIIAGVININGLKPSAKSDLIMDILKNTESEILEFGIRTNYSTENEGERECANILNKFNLDGSKNIDVFKDKNLYTLEFKTEEISGYIQYIKKNYDRGTITISVIEHKANLGLNELRNRVEKAIDNSSEEKKYFQYVKAKTGLSDITYAKDTIAGLLNRRGAANIDSIDIGKGSSITAYTGDYERMKSGLGWIDFNCAVVSYESGNYIIIGTPIIMNSY